jgi:hypothetical protein
LGLADDLDDVDCLPRHEEIAVAMAFEGLRVEDVTIGRHGDVLAQLEENPGLAAVTVVSTRCHEKWLEGLKANVRNGMTIGEERAHCGKSCRVLT